MAQWPSEILSLYIKFGIRNGRGFVEPGSLFQAALGNKKEMEVEQSAEVGTASSQPAGHPESNGEFAGRTSKKVLPEETISSEVLRWNFKRICYQVAQGPLEVYSRLPQLCHQWLKPERCTKSELLHLVILEQFLAVLPPEMESWVGNVEQRAVPRWWPWPKASSSAKQKMKKSSRLCVGERQLQGPRSSAITNDQVQRRDRWK